MMSFFLILSASLTGCTQKNFEIAPGASEPTTSAPNQPYAVPNNDHPIFIEEFNFNTNKKSNQTNNGNNVQPPPSDNQNNKNN